MDARDRYPEDCEDWRDDGTEMGLCLVTGDSCTEWCLEDDDADDE